MRRREDSEDQGCRGLWVRSGGAGGDHERSIVLTFISPRGIIPGRGLLLRYLGHSDLVLGWQSSNSDRLSDQLTEVPSSSGNTIARRSLSLAFIRSRVVPRYASLKKLEYMFDSLWCRGLQWRRRSTLGGDLNGGSDNRLCGWPHGRRW